MNVKSIAVAGIAAALMAFATVPASANTNASNDAASGTVARFDAPATSSYCGCGGYRYVRYYRVRYVRYYYRYYY
jgi:hypothetical protein